MQSTHTVRVADSARALHFRWNAKVHESGGHFLVGPGSLAVGEQRLELDAVRGTSAYEVRWNRPTATGFLRLVYRDAGGKEFLLASVLVIPVTLEPVAPPGRSPERQVAAPTRPLTGSGDRPHDFAALRLPGTAEAPPSEPTAPPPRA